jgi:predicted extracellular nuclease
MRIAFWNLENLFDLEDAPDRPPELAAVLRGELVGWTSAVLARKLDNLAAVIELMFDGIGPDLLGVCEAENERVLEQLVDRIGLEDRTYRVASHPSPDARGIDVSFLYDDRTLELVNKDHQVVIKRTATRDIFWVRMRERASGKELVAIGNHWPSRSGGQYESEPARMVTAETLAHVIREETREGPDLPFVVMGDLNDEPFNRSVMERLQAVRDPGRVRGSKSGHLLNLMWPLMMEEDPGSYLYGSDWNMLDQFMVSKHIVREEDYRVAGPVVILKPDRMTTGSTNRRPRRYGRPANGSLDPDGASDHFPIEVVLDPT